MSRVSQKLPDRFSEMYSVQNAANEKKKNRPRSSHGVNLASNNLTLKKFEELDAMMMKSLANLKDDIIKLNAEDFMNGQASTKRSTRFQ